jgi:hypothetical protein
MEIDKLIDGADIVRYNKAQRIKCLGHIRRMDQAKPTRKLFDWKSNCWGISKEWTKQNQLGSYSIGNQIAGAYPKNGPSKTN